jgi:hypothetical protein
MVSIHTHVKILFAEVLLINVQGRARCLELMAEDPERQHRRAYLLREREKLTKAQEDLASLRPQEVENGESDVTMRGVNDGW